MKISDDVIRCTNCELCHSRKNAVPGEGSSSAKVVFVGEAPGRFEDVQGKPFVGAAGKILEGSTGKREYIQVSSFHNQHCKM